LRQRSRHETTTGYQLIRPDDLHWRPSNLMKIPNADFLERTGSENLSARLWRLPPGSANTLHRHVRQEEFYFVLEGVGAHAHLARPPSPARPFRLLAATGRR
jgi:mannose-6-phosphate isomerase-like protein (cupin superfamily)